MPGERVRVELIEEKRGYGRARLVEVLEPSPERTAPRCPHYGECGGCHYQHMSYSAQLKARQLIIKDQFERIAGLSLPDEFAVFESARVFEYRNHIQFHLTPAGDLGYHRARSDSVLAVRECHLPEPPLNALWPQLNFEPDSGIERIGLRLGAGDDLQIVLESSRIETPELIIEDLPVSAVHLSPGGAIVMAGSPDLNIEVLGRNFRVSAGSFFQTNTQVAEQMVQYILGRLEDTGALHPNAAVLMCIAGWGYSAYFWQNERVG
jgi:23S rRNA (uracil1939-C5)-methyltransferase